MATEVNPDAVVSLNHEKCVVCNSFVLRDQLRSFSTAKGPEVRALIKECLGLDVSTGFICRRKCFKRLQDIKSKLQTMTENVIQSVAIETEPSTSESAVASTPKILPESQIKTATGKRIVVVTVKKTESGIETVQQITDGTQEPFLVMDPSTITGAPKVASAEAHEETKSLVDHSYIEGYSMVDSNVTIDRQLLELKSEDSAEQFKNLNKNSREGNSTVDVQSDISDLLSNDKSNENNTDSAQSLESNQTTSNESQSYLGTDRLKPATVTQSTLPLSVAKALDLSPAVSAKLAATDTPNISYADTSNQDIETENFDRQSEYKEAIKADRIKAALKNTLVNLLKGEIDFSTELRFQGTAFVRLDSVNVVKLKVNETAQRDDLAEFADSENSPNKDSDGNSRYLNRSKLVEDPSMVQEIFAGSKKFDKGTQTKTDKKRPATEWEDESPVKRPKTIIGPDMVKAQSKVELPGKQQVSVTFIPNEDDASAATELPNTVDVSQLQGVLSNLMNTTSAQLGSTIVTSGALSNEIAEAVASLGTGVVEQQAEPHENIMQAAVASLNLTEMDTDGTEIDDTIEEQNDTVDTNDNDNEGEYDNDEVDTGPTSAKSETVKVDGLLYDGMQFLLTYTQENCSRWNCAEKGCRASVNTTPLPNEYTIESLVTPTVLCATPHDVMCHQEGVNKVKEEDMRRVNGFVGIAEDDGKEVLAVYGYRFTRHNLPGVGVESRWLCFQQGCFTTIFTDVQDNVNMFGWPYHSHPPQLYTEPTDARLDGEPTVVLTLTQKEKPRKTLRRGRPSLKGTPGLDRRRRHDYNDAVIHVEGKKYNYNILQKDGIYECEVCHKQYSTFKACRKHTSLVHYKPDEFQCKVCGKKGKDAKQMMQHEQRHLSDKDRPLKCEFCDRGYVKEFELKKHMELNHGATQRRWECPTCGKYFLREHTYQMHLKTPDACNKYCEEKAEVESTKTINITRLTSRAKESTANFCTVCKLYYKDNKALRLHLVKAMCSQHMKSAIKTAAEQYGCHRCEAVFSERPTLIRHLLFQCHKQDLVCEKCGTMFKTEDDHTQHITLCVMRNTPLNPVVSNTKGLACRKCGSTFISQRSVAIHEGKCKAKPLNISPIKSADIEKYNLTPCKIRVGKASNAIGTRLSTGRVRRLPKRYADEAFEKGWAETRDVKVECELQLTKPKPTAQNVRLSGGKMLETVGQLESDGKQIKSPTGVKFFVQGTKAIRTSSGSPMKIVTIGKNSLSDATSSNSGNSAMLVEEVKQGDVTVDNVKQQYNEQNDEEIVTVTLDDNNTAKMYLA